jgi:uncharacterized surface protein with fasciclin (FAS1) repeats
MDMTGMTALQRKTAVAGLAALAVFGVAGCSSEEASSTASSATSAAESAVESATSEMTTSSAAPAADPAANLIGTGCAAYAEQVPEGPGSVAGMAADPVTVAASNNPMLSTLTQALSGQLNPDVNLVDTLNGGEFTVFAPTNDAFAKIDPATLETLKTDDELLTNILTYHVVPGQAAPDQVAGEHTTVQGAPLTVTGAGNDLMVNDAGLVCGGVKTANATVYMIDTVLMPPAN